MSFQKTPIYNPHMPPNAFKLLLALSTLFPAIKTLQSATAMVAARLFA